KQRAAQLRHTARDRVRDRAARERVRLLPLPPPLAGKALQLANELPARDRAHADRNGDRLLRDDAQQPEAPGCPRTGSAGAARQRDLRVAIAAAPRPGTRSAFSMAARARRRRTA